MSQAPFIRPRGSRDLSANHKYLYQFVLRAGHLSRADLTRKSGLTFPSVSRLTADLLELGLLKEGASRRGGMGKPPVELGVDPNHGFSLGVRLDGNKPTGSFVNVLGKSLKEVSFRAASLAEGIESTLTESGLDPEKLIGVGLATLEEPLGGDEQERLTTALGVPVFVLPVIAASVRAERYFGSASELSRFLYFDAQSPEIGAVVNSTVLAQPGTLEKLLGVRQGKKDVLPEAIKAAVSLVQAEALVVGGLSAEDLESLSKSMGDLTVVPASAQASDPTLAAASVPLDQTFGF